MGSAAKVTSVGASSQVPTLLQPIDGVAVAVLAGCIAIGRHQEQCDAFTARLCPFVTASHQEVIGVDIGAE